MTPKDPQKMNKTSASHEGYNYCMADRASKQTYTKYTYMTPAYITEMTALAEATDYYPYLYAQYIGIIGKRASGLADTEPLNVRFYKAASDP